MDDAEAMNARLAALYLKVWPQLSTILREDGDHSNPLLIQVAQEYVRAERRIMIVGQETFGWWGTFVASCPEKRIEFLQARYAQFDFGAGCISPFWRGAHELRERLAPGSHRRALAWGNLNVADRQKGRATGEEASLAALGILRCEIEILQPDVVVFLTGPNYDNVLARQFPSVNLSIVGAFLLRHLARVEHPKLPAVSFRTYHPNYLSRAKQWNLLDEIALAA